MDYKYIEQLLDRYWECHTTTEEEQILRSFFSQHDLPEHLAQYAPLFAFVKEAEQDHVSSNFDQRFGELLADDDSRQTARFTHARRLTLSRRVAPLLKAAAVVAILFTIGTATERAIVGNQAEDNATQPALTDTYVRSADVEAVIQPTDRTTDATATVQNTDSLAKSVLPVENE